VLSAEQAALFATLGGFAGSVDLETIGAVDGSDCLDTLTALVEHSLVRPTADPAGPADGRRFELADPVRQYARRRLEGSGREAEVRSAQLRWYARRAAAASSRAGHAEQRAWFARLRADLPDLRAALAWAHASGQAWTGLRLAADLAPFATASGLHREGRAWLELALTDAATDPNEHGAARSPDPAPPEAPAPAGGTALARGVLLARARQSAGKLAFLQCDYPHAVHRLTQAEAGFRLLADPGGRAQCLQALAGIARERGDYVSAVETLERARACWTDAGEDEAAQLAGIGLAFTLLLEGTVDRARRLAEDALPSAYVRADTVAITDSLLVLGGAFLAEGDLDSAAGVIREALDRAERDELAEARAYAVEWLAVVARELGQHEASAGLLAEALQRQYDLGDLWRTASVLVNAAVCELSLGRPGSAARALGASAGVLVRIAGQLPPVDRSARDRVRFELVRLLGESAVDRAERAGRRAPLGEAIGRLRQNLLSAPAGPSSAAGAGPDPAPVPRGPSATAAADLSRSAGTLGPAGNTVASAPRRSPPAVGCPPLDLLALGGEDVRRGGRPLSPADFGYAKPRELLFFLAERGPADKSQIGLALWPEASRTELRSAFHTTLHHLRRAVGVDRVIFAAGRYRLAERELRYDADGFRQGLAAARAARDSRAAGRRSAVVSELELLEHALSLYPGDLLPAWTAPWVEASREDLHSMHRRALLAAARLAHRSGRGASAVAAYERLIELDPLAEVAHRELMLCFAARGERGRALHQYEVLWATLHEQLGVGPDPQTTAVRDSLDDRIVAAR
jgi:DNA-binding SARP family transcriptional activator